MQGIDIKDFGKEPMLALDHVANGDLRKPLTGLRQAV
jgi:hypothetical protein